MSNDRELTTTEATFQRMKAKIERLRSALEFYANPDNNKMGPGGAESAVYDDFGKLARTTLGKWTEYDQEKK